MKRRSHIDVDVNVTTINGILEVCSVNYYSLRDHYNKLSSGNESNFLYLLLFYLKS